MSIVTNYQVEASEKSAQAIEEQLRLDHRLSMICYDIQDLAQNVVNLFVSLNQDVERWQRQTTIAPQNVPADIASTYDGYFQRTTALFEKTAALIKMIEEKGYEIKGKKIFLESWREIRGIVSHSRQDVTAAVEQVRRGEVKPLRQVKDELWDRPIDRGPAPAC
jgi:hypothetical protein